LPYVFINLSSDHNEITGLLKKTLTRLEHLVNIYKSGSLEKKRQLVGSIFPENLMFDENTVRTPRINEGIDFIYQISSKLRGKKNGTNPFNLDLSRGVRPKGQKSNLLLEDLRKLAALFDGILP
jgi:site-specific DNA recombinase